MPARDLPGPLTALLVLASWPGRDLLGPGIIRLLVLVVVLTRDFQGTPLPWDCLVLASAGQGPPWLGTS